MNNFVNGTSYEFIPNTESESGTFTHETGITTEFSDVKYIGNLVCVNLSVSGSFAADTEKTVGTLSNVPFPSESAIVTASAISLVDGLGWATAWITSSGEVKVRPKTAQNTIQFTLMYIA